MWKVYNNTNLANNEDNPGFAYLTETDAVRVNYPWSIKPYKATINATLQRNPAVGYSAGQAVPAIATEVIPVLDLTPITKAEYNRAWFAELFNGADGEVAPHVIPIYGTLAGLVAHLNTEFDAVYVANSDVYTDIVVDVTTAAQLASICDTWADDIYDVLMATSNPGAGPVRLYPTAYIQDVWEALMGMVWPGLGIIDFSPFAVFPDELAGFPNP